MTAKKKAANLNASRPRPHQQNGNPNNADTGFSVKEIRAFLREHYEGRGFRVGRVRVDGHGDWHVSFPQAGPCHLRRIVHPAWVINKSMERRQQHE